MPPKEAFQTVFEALKAILQKHEPDLLDGMSDRLKKRMQGKSCFNFRSTDAQLFDELAQATEKSVARLKREKLL